VDSRVFNLAPLDSLKSVLSTYINGIAMVMFILAGAVLWPHAILMFGGTILVGYWGVYSVRKVGSKLVRWFVVAVGVGRTLFLSKQNQKMLGNFRGDKGTRSNNIYD
jgi:uncharacterized protein